MVTEANREFLRLARPDLYRRAVYVASIITNNIDNARAQRTAAEVESAIIELLCTALEGPPA